MLDQEDFEHNWGMVTLGEKTTVVTIKEEFTANQESRRALFYKFVGPWARILLAELVQCNDFDVRPRVLQNSSNPFNYRLAILPSWIALHAAAVVLSIVGAVGYLLYLVHLKTLGPVPHMLLNHYRWLLGPRQSGAGEGGMEQRVTFYRKDGEAYIVVE